MRNKRILRPIALFLVLTIITEILTPSLAFALTAGPTSPEFSKFQPVSTSEMVNAFTGDFSYNLPVVEIPGPDGAGYALSLSYQGGVSSEEEASWVGFGWTLNPGAINRNTRGFPDDFDGQAIKRYNKTRQNVTVTGTNSATLEFFSKNDAKTKDNPNGTNKEGEGTNLGNIGLNASVGFNNYSGYRFTMGLAGGFNLFRDKQKYKGFGGFLGGGIQIDQSRKVTFNPNISLSMNVGLYRDRTNKEKMANEQKAQDVFFSPGDPMINAALGGLILAQNYQRKQVGSVGTSLSLSSVYGLFTFSGNNYNTSLNKTNKDMFNVSGGLMVPFFNPNLGMQFGFAGSLSVESSEPYETLRMNGYMNNINGLDGGVLTDYYLERGTSFDKRDKYLGIPFNNADNFAVSGEGIGGGFRYYPNRIGHFYPTPIENTSYIKNFGFELNLGGNVGVGVDLGLGFSKNSIGNWGSVGNTGDQAFSSDGFFRFNGDLGGEVSYGNSELWNAKILRNLIFPEPNTGTDRFELKNGSIGRTSFISHKSYSQSSSTPFNPQYIHNDTRGIAGKTISEISIHNSSGMRYIYGQPVYSRNETNLNFEVKPNGDDIKNKYLAYKNIPLKAGSLDADYDVDVNNPLATIVGDIKPVATIVGDIKPAPFANSFLLTQIYSNDYVDLGAPGCSLEDFGSWTQFSYAKRYGNKGDRRDDCGVSGNSQNQNEWYRWRAPYNGLTYNQNSISNTKDDMGSVSTGQKEVLYLKSIETKTHIAFFVTNKSFIDRWKEELTRIDWLSLVDAIEYSNIKIPGCDTTKYEYSRANQTITNQRSKRYKCIKNLLTSCRIRDTRTGKYRYDWKCLKDNFGDFISQYLLSSCQDRKDGLGARNLDGSNDPMSANAGVKNNGAKLEFLEKIVLFSKARMDKPLKVTHFQYDYSLVKNLPNNVDGNYPNPRNNEQSGKLTLKKVWFEYEGTTSTQTSPYEFTYKYKDKTTFPQYLKNKYPNFVLMNQNFSDKAQNPDYDPHLLDIWGNIQPYGKERSSRGISWRYQGLGFTSNDNLGGWRSLINNTTLHEYDPAAWHLKQIKLPSGGEILVEYEEKDYEFVQDRPVMAMTSLKSIESDTENQGVYVINLLDLGIDANNPQEVQQQFQKIQEYFRKEGKVKFKFLYKLLGDGMPSIDDCRSDYIDGYARVKGVVLNNQEIKIILGGEGASSAPRQACWDFYTSQRIGKLKGGGNNCDDVISFPSFNSEVSGLETVGTVKDLLREFPSVPSHIPQKGNVGATISPSMSFLRLPMLKKKKGGGVRVKRLLMFDAGIETGDANLYGQEYFYEKGVATNEPAGARDENPLVTLLDKQSIGGFEGAYDKLTVGEDKEQLEGPLGESLLPGASIGYSKVIVENIHKGETGTGYTVQDFYTVADYPFDKNYSVNSYKQPDQRSDFSIEDKQVISSVSNTNLSGDNRIENKLPIPLNISANAGIINLSLSLKMSGIFASQGYRFIISNMHGQTKKTATYRGSYSNQAQSKLMSSQEYFYYEPGEKLKILKYNKNINKYELDYALPGKEADMTMDMRQVREETIDMSLSVDFGIGLAPLPPPAFSAALGFGYSQSNISTHTVSKVIRYPVVVKRVESIQDGIRSVTENLVFSEQTGQCLLTKTFDGYHDIQKTATEKHDGSLYSLSMPAFWYYPEMGQKALNPNGNNPNQNLLTAMAGNVNSYGENPLNTLISGNFVRNVSQTQVQTFAKDWFKRSTIKDQLKEEYNITSEQELALNKIYRPLANYVYRSNVTSANANDGRIYKDGLIPTINMFNAWDFNDTPPSNWLLGSMIKEYSPNGQALEETNALDIPSSARFGYKNMVPSIVAANAKYTNIYFEDFENLESDAQFNVQNSFAHSGKNSLRINALGQKLISKMYNNQRLRSDNSDANKGGAIVRMWVNNAQDGDLSVYLSQNTQPYPCIKIAQVMDWTLMEANIPSSVFDNMPINQKFDVFVKSNSSVFSNISVDDVKFQPKNAQTTCYVYDVATLKLLAQFDDQHFGMFFQYDAEGKLTRKMVETIKGISTVTESQYNTPKRK